MKIRFKMKRLLLLLIVICVIFCGCYPARYKPHAQEKYRKTFDKPVTNVGEIVYDDAELLWCELDNDELVLLDKSGDELSTLNFDAEILQVASFEDNCIMVYLASGCVETYEYLDDVFVKTHNVLFDGEVKQISFVGGTSDSDNTFLVLKADGTLFAFGRNKNGIISDELDENTTCDLPVEIYSDVNMICKNLVLLNSGEIFDFANSERHCGFIEADIDDLKYCQWNLYVKENGKYYSYTWDYKKNEMINGDDITFGRYSYISFQEGGVCYTGEVYAESKLKDIPSVKDSLVEGVPEYDHYYPAYQGLVGYTGNDLVFYGL